MQFGGLIGKDAHRRIFISQNPSTRRSALHAARVRSTPVTPDHLTCVIEITSVSNASECRTMGASKLIYQ